MKSLSIIQPIIQRWYIIVIAVCCTIAVAKRAQRYRIAKFESTAKIKLADTKEGTPSANLYKDFDVFANENKITAELELIKSAVLIHSALDSLQLDASIYRVGQMRTAELYKESPFVVSAVVKNSKWYGRILDIEMRDTDYTISDAGKSIRITGKIDEVVVLPGLQLVLMKNTKLLESRPHLAWQDHYQIVLMDRERLTEEIRAGLDVTAVDKDVPVLRISYKCEVPQEEDLFHIIQEQVGGKMMQSSHDKYRNNGMEEKCQLYSLRKLRAIGQGDDKFVQKMLRMFIQSAKEDVSKIEQSFEAGNYSLMRKTAHRLKPSLDNMGIQSLYAVIRSIEAMQETPEQITITRRNIETLKDIVTTVCQNLSSLLNEG